MLNDAKLVKGDLNLLQELLDDSWISGIYIAGHGNDPEAPRSSRSKQRTASQTRLYFAATHIIEASSPRI